MKLTKPLSTYVLILIVTARLAVAATTIAAGPAASPTPTDTAPEEPAWVTLQGEVYGAKADATGPIGGGAGYQRIVTKGDFTVKDLDGLLAALAQAKAGQVVFLPGDIEIDCTTRVYIEKTVLVVPGGVTLASDRGHNGSQGALLTSDALATSPLIRAAGSGVRISGLRIRGPNPKRYLDHHRRSFGKGGGGHAYYYKFPTSEGIRTAFPGLEVDNCDISAFSHGAICLGKGDRHRVHHSFIHHCQYNGLGYGVCHAGSSSLIEYNLFDFNRHSIAGTGQPGCSYEARHNIELGTSLSHCFDMHGGRDRKDGTDIAGTTILIHHNTFRAPQRPVCIRGVPEDACKVFRNWFPKHATGDAAVMAADKTTVIDNAYGAAPVVPPAWKAGVARAKITPASPMYLAGFGGRSGAAEGTLLDIWAKALVIEAGDGNRAVVFTTDVCGVSRATYLRVCDQLHKRFGLKQSQVLLTYSHTHTGPALDECLQDYCEWDAGARTRIKDYTMHFEATLVRLVAEALGKLEPVTLCAGQGRVGFGVNRRNNKESHIDEILAKGEPLRGPVDHNVPVLATRRANGQWQAAVFGYACHTSTIGLLKWSGDYAGFAMAALEQQYPSAQAMFFQACGGDQGAMPRRKVELTEKYGRMLTDGVGQVLEGSTRPLAGTLRTAVVTIDLPFEKVATREDLQEWGKRSKVYERWAKRMLQKLDRGETFASSWPYTVQAWRLGDQLWIALAGEAVVDYSLKFKQKYGDRTWTSGFAHELTAYIPSRRVWEEGGYEGGYLGEYGLPAMRWTGDLEDRITAAVEKVVAAVNAP